MISNSFSQIFDHQQYLKQIIEDIIQDIISIPHIRVSLSLTDVIPYIHNTNYNINQVKCYQQNSSNLCGYHAIFNAFCFLKLLNKQECQYDLRSCASFWKFKTKIQTFLFRVKEEKKLLDQWPWRNKDILEGDFQRLYYKISMQKFQQFSIFKNHQNFTLLSHTWAFQFGNLILEQDSQIQLQKSFQLFSSYKGQKPIIVHLMLGITTHWLTFFAVKNNQMIEYWYFDSENCLSLDFTWNEIVEYIQKYGRPEQTKFQKQSDCMCLKDIQISLKLIINCLQGKQTLASYAYNKRFETFGKKLFNCLQNYEQATQVIRQYEFDIRQFLLLKIEWQVLSSQNRQIMKAISDLSRNIKQFSQQGCFLYQLFSMQNDFV